MLNNLGLLAVAKIHKWPFCLFFFDFFFNDDFWPVKKVNIAYTSYINWIVRLFSKWMGYRRYNSFVWTLVTTTIVVLLVRFRNFSSVSHNEFNSMNWFLICDWCPHDIQHMTCMHDMHRFERKKIINLDETGRLKFIGIKGKIGNRL